MQEETPQEDLVDIKVSDVPIFIRKEWKKNLILEKDVIADETLVGHSKVISDSKFPFCINLTNSDFFTVIFKLNIASALTNGLNTQKYMAFYISRKTWKKDILATK